MRGFLAAMLVLTAIPMPRAEGKDQSGVLRRVSCTVVRFYVAQYSASAVDVGRVAVEQPRLKSRLPGVA
jgi:hypothetical protein